MTVTALDREGRKSGTALERLKDSTYHRDNEKFYFVDDGDFSMEYDEDGADVLQMAGADARYSDTQQLQFGDVSDVYMTWDGTGFKLVGLPTSSDAGAGYLYCSDAGALVGCIRIGT